MFHPNFSYIIPILFFGIIFGVWFSRWYIDKFRAKYLDSLSYFPGSLYINLREKLPFGINFLMKKEREAIHIL
jgi:hypothetical protein